MTIYVTYEPSEIYKGPRPLRDDDYLLGLTVGQLLNENGWSTVTCEGERKMTVSKSKPVTEADVQALHHAKCEAQSAADAADKAYREASRALRSQK